MGSIIIEDLLLMWLLLPSGNIQRDAIAASKYRASC